MCKLMAHHQGRDFVLRTDSGGYFEIGFGGIGSHVQRVEGWMRNRDQRNVILSDQHNVFGCFNHPKGRFSYCIFQRLDGNPVSMCDKFIN